jgi:hypothetical protein
MRAIRWDLSCGLGAVVQKGEQFDDVFARSVHLRHRQPVPAHPTPVRYAVDAEPFQAELLAHGLDQLASSVEVHA